MGHVGRGNIYFTWPFIKVALVLNYFGQGAWMLRNQNNPELADAEGINPFFQMMDPNVRYVAVVLSVTAGIIASQALITGAFTMVSEATGLNWMPHLQVCYPARTRGQLYIPVVNVVLCVATLAVLLLFRDSEHISAAYGLALTITMITPRSCWASTCGTAATSSAPLCSPSCSWRSRSCSSPPRWPSSCTAAGSRCCSRWRSS